VQSRDTDERIEQLRLERIRQMSPAQRLDIVAQLSEDVRSLQMVGIRMRHPEYSDEQVRHALFRLLYGEELFKRVWPDVPLVAP
jgi:hypothetical protein